MAKDSPTEAQLPRVATIAQISQAIEALSPADSERLEQIALNRVVRIGHRAANGRTSNDLLQESLRRILDQNRKWYPQKVRFVPFVVGVVFSVASEWAGHRKRNFDSPEYAKLESEAARETDEGVLQSPFEVLASSDRTPETELIAAEVEADQGALVGEIERHFTEDDNALSVLMGWEEGMDGPRIRQEFGFTETLYESTVRRIKRQSRKILEKRNGG